MASSIAERWTVLDRFIQEQRYKKIMKYIRYGSVLADLGCGTGEFLKYVRNRIATGYGVDAHIKSCSENNTLFFLYGDLNTAIPLDDESVDIITALAVIEHLTRPEVFVRETLRILKPEGYCILTTPSPRAKPLLEFLAYKVRVISEKDIRDHKNYFNKVQLVNLFASFKKVQVKHFQLGLNTLIVATK